MQEDIVKLLVAGSMETAAAIEQALHGQPMRFRVLRVDSAQGLDDAVRARDWQIVFGELETPGFTALDLRARLTTAGLAVPVVIIEGSGRDEIYFRCLESGRCHFIRLDTPHLASLPRLVGALLRNAEQEHERLRVEKRLLESEERFLDVLDNTSDLIQCVGPDGRITFTNRAWRETLGYSDEEARSLNLRDVLHPDSALCCQDRFSRLLGGESLNCIEFKFVTRTGETVYLSGDCGAIVKDGGVISTRGIFKNISDTVRAQVALKASEARYQALYENAPDIHAVISADGEILTINQTGARMLGYDADELIGESAAKVIHPEDQRTVLDAVGRLFSVPGSKIDIEYRKVRKDGSVFWVHQRASLDPGGDGRQFLTVCRDITEKRYLEDKLAFHAAHDALTHLLNRREFERRLNKLLEHAESDDRHVLCFLDLDQFKRINDSCGHLAGDELLRKIATLLRGGMRARDTLARIGGDEFAVLMEHTSVEQAMQVAEKIREIVSSFEFHWRSQRFSVGVSIGVVPIRIGGSLADVLGMADTACYTAKRAGRNRIHSVVD